MEQGMTPSQIETAARRMLNAVGSQFWSSDEIIGDYLYFAALEMAQETFCIENRYTTTSVDGQKEYQNTARMLAVKRLTYDGTKLKQVSFLELDSIDINLGNTGTGIPQYYYFFDDVFGLHPTPGESAKIIKTHTLDEPDKPTSSSTLEIPTQFHGYLVIGVAYYMSLKELGHPHVSRLEFMWNHPANRNNAIKKTQRSMRMRNHDQLKTVTKESIQPSTIIGMV
jgi:hypothetical protein